MSTKTWDILKPAFEQQFLDKEPALVTKFRLESHTLSSSKTIEYYWTIEECQFLQLGSKLGHQADQLMTNFLNSLPYIMKDFIIGQTNMQWIIIPLVPIYI